MMDNLLTLSNNKLYFADKICVDAVIGKGGLTNNKHEGDGATPVGIFALRRLFYRADRIALPDCGYQVCTINQKMGWCDDPTHDEYNKLVDLPFSYNHEKLWRDDHVYDVFFELGYNDRPVEKGYGSAIFLHLMRPDRKLTEGCVAITQDSFLAMLCLPIQFEGINITP